MGRKSGQVAAQPGRALKGIEVARELSQGAVFEHRSQGKVYPVADLQAGHQPGGDQAVAAEGEEVVVGANHLLVKQLAPQGGEAEFRRRFKGTLRSTPRSWLLGLRQTAAVNLAAGIEGQRVEPHKKVRHHESRQDVEQRGTQFSVGCIRCIGLVQGTPIGDQPLILREPSGDNNSAIDRCQSLQCRLNLATFDSKAAQFDLLINTAQVVDGAIRAKARQITCAIKPACSEWIGQKAFCGQLRPLVIATPNTRATDVELTGDTRWHRLQLTVENGCRGAADGPADGGFAAEVGRNEAAGGVDGRLRGAIEVVEALDAGALPHPSHQVAAEFLASQVDNSHRGGQFRGAHQFRHGGGDGVDQRHLISCRQARQSQSILGEDDRATHGEGQENFKDGDVETDGG